MSPLIPVAAVAAAVLITWAAVGLRRAARLERVLEDHDRNEADLKALAGALREDKPCGCHWVPCDKHDDRLLRVIRKDGEL